MKACMFVDFVGGSHITFASNAPYEDKMSSDGMFLLVNEICQQTP